MARYSKIFAALDDGGTRLAVARRALSIAHDNKAEVLFCHAINASLLEQAGVDGDEVATKSEQALSDSLERQLTRARGGGDRREHGSYFIKFKCC